MRGYLHAMWRSVLCCKAVWFCHETPRSTRTSAGGGGMARPAALLVLTLRYVSCTPLPVSAAGGGERATRGRGRKEKQTIGKRDKTRLLWQGRAHAEHHIPLAYEEDRRRLLPWPWPPAFDAKSQYLMDERKLIRKIRAELIKSYSCLKGS